MLTIQLDRVEKRTSKLKDRGKVSYNEAERWNGKYKRKRWGKEKKIRRSFINPIWITQERPEKIKEK